MNVKGLHRLKKFKPLGIMLGLMAAFFFSSFVYAELSSHQPSAPSAEQSQQADPQSGSSYSHDPTNFTAYIPYAKSATLEADFSGFLQNYTGIKLANGMRSYALTVPAGIFQYRWLAQNDTHSWAGGRFDYEKKKGIPRTAVISNGTSSINTSSLVGYWRFEQSSGSAATNDSSGYGNMGTLTNMNLTGNATSGLIQGRFGNALLFDGVNDYVNVPDSANLDINETTISMWVYPKQVLRNIYQGLAYKGQEGTNNFHIGIEVTSGKLLGGFGDGTGWDSRISTYVVPQNQWVHLALVGKSNDSIKMYANGVEIYTASLIHGIQTNANAMFIGLGYASSNEYFNGTIDEVMVWNRSLTASEILMLNGSRAVYGNTTLILDQPQSDYPDNLTYVMYRNQSVVSNSAGLVGYWKFEQSNGSAATNDSSGFGNTGTLTNMNLTGNATSGPTLGGRFGSALVFDGVNDNINAGDPSSGVLDFGDSANFTVSAWVRTSAIIPQYGMGVVSKWAGGLGGAAGAAYLLTVGDSYGDAGSPSSATFRINSGWSITHFANGTTQIADGNWHHLAGVRDGTNISIYVDGRLEGITFANSSSLANTRNLRIGISYDTATVGDFNGTIDEVRIYNRSLSAAEITEMYNQTRPAGFEYYISNTTGNANYTAHESPVIPLTIDTAVLTGNLYINGSQADTNYVYGQIANATATTGTRINNEGTLYLLRNGTEVGIRSGSNFAMNETLLGASLYNFTSAWVGSNYTFTNITYTLTIGKAKPVLIISNGTSSLNTSGLVGYWRFEQSNGSAATNDSSGYGNMGTLTNMNLTGNATSGLAQGRFGNALNFDGVNDYVDVGAGSALNMTEAFTLSAWINPKAMPADGSAFIFSKAGAYSGGQYHVYTSGTSLRLILEESATITETLVGGNVVTDTWQHIAVTFNNVSNTAVFYINGVNTTVTTSIAPTAIYSDRAPRIGVRGTTGYFNGTIDEVQIWNRTLTADEINLLYQSNAVYGNTTLMLQMPNKGVRNADSNLNTLTYRNQTVIQNDTGLVGYWNLDEGTGTAAYDKSGYGNTGTLTNINTSNPNGLTSNSTSGWNESGRFGYGLKFDGVNDYVNVTDSNSLDITGELTVTAWIKHSHTPARWHGIAYKGEEGTNNYHFAVSPDGFLAGGMGNGTVWDTQTSTYTVTTEWTHVAFVAKANDFNKMYANGVEVYTRGLPNGFQTNARDLVIGQGYVPAAEFFNGTIDEVRIYNRSLTAQEIIEMYNQTRPAGYEYYLVNTTGNANYTSQEFMLPLNISRATPTLYAGFNVSSGTTYGNPVLVYGNTSNQQVQTDATLAIRLNGSQIKSGTGNQTLGLVLWAGISEFNLTSTATANYTGSSLNSTDFNVSKSTPILALSQNNSFPTGSGLVGYWSFDENTSATAYDSSGKNNDGTLTDMGTGVSATSGHNTTDCKFGNCLVFDGVNDYVDVGAGSALNMTEAFTLSAWINPRAMPADGSAFIFSKAGAYSGGQYHFYTLGTSLRLILEESATITETLVGGNVVTDTWQHIAVAFNNVSNTAVFYINGVNTTVTTSIAPTAIYSDRSLRIGVRGTTGYFNGTIDEVRIYNYSMSAQQVMDSMNATIRDLPITYANATNITGFIRLGDNSTSLILDRNGTIIGGGHSVVSENKTLFGTGIYSYNLTYRESQNYTAKNITRILNVPKAAAPTLTLYVNGTQASTSWVYGQPTNATVTKTATFRDEGLLRLLRNGTSVGSGGPDNISESMLFGAGIYNYSATFGDVLGNYTNTSILSNRDVTIDKAKPVLIINNNTASVNTSGLVGYWRFEQSNGSAATNDSSGYGNTGTLTNMNLTGNATSGLTQGRFGNALRFDGVNDYVDAGNAASLRIASSLTLSAWVKLDGTQNGRFVIKGDGVGASTFSYILDNNAVSGFRFYTSNGSSGVGSMRNAVETTGVWYFVAGVYDSSQNMQYLYVDGVLIDSDSIVGVADVNDNVYIGRDTSGTAPLKGTIDEVQIWNRSLTADEINLLYQSHAVYGNTTLMLQLPNKGVRDADSNLNTLTYRNQTLIQNDTGLVGYWNLDEGAGTASYDKSGYGNTGTLTNMNTSNPNGLTSNATSGWNESGRFGYGLRFDGVNDFVNMTTAGISNTSGTFEFWIKPEGTWSDMSNQTILSVPSDTSSSEAGLTELWRLDEGNGGVTNGTKNKMNGTMTAAWVDGIFGNAIRVNGSSSGGYAAINDGGTLSGMTSLTVTAWLKPDRWSTNTRLLDHEWDFYFDFDSGGTGLSWAVTNTTSNTVSLTKALDIDKWVFVAGTYNGSIVRLFINGALVSGAPQYGTIRDSTNTLGIGCKSDGGNCHNGTIDDVGIYKNKALTEQEIRRLYLGGLSVSKNMDTLEFNTGNVTQTYSVSSWANEWHHVSGTYSVSTADIYIDGMLANSSASFSSIHRFGSEMYLGSAWATTAPKWGFNGTIDEARIYNRSLTAQEIIEMYNQTRPAGYEYYLLNTTGNANYTAQEFLIPLNITQAVLNGNLYINRTQASQTWTYPNSTNVTATTGTRINNEGTLYLLRNGTEVGIRNGANFAMNESMLGVSIYNYTAAWVGSNYTFTNITYDLTINKATPNIIIYLNGSFAGANQTNLTYPNATIVNGTIIRLLGNLNATLFRNNTIITSAQNENLTLSASFWNYTAWWAGDENYTANATQLNLTMLKGSLAFNLYINGTEGSVTYTYPNGTNATATIGTRINNEGAFSLLRNGTPIGSGGNNNRSEELLFGAGIYNYSANASGFFNYTITDILSGRILTIARGNPNIALFLNGSQSDVSSYVYNNPINATAYRTSILYNNEGTLQLWRNGTSLGSGGPGNISEILVLPAGIHNYSAILINIANYTYSNVSYVMTIQKATPILALAQNNSFGTASGLVGYWSFDENATATTYDSSGFNNDGTLYNGVKHNTTGKFGNALYFDGSNDYVNISSSSSLNVSGSGITIEAWAYPDVISGNTRPIVLKTNPATTDLSYALQIVSSQVQVGVQISSDWCYLSGNIVTAGSWYHLAGVYNGTNFTIYINGALTNTGRSSSTACVGSVKPNIQPVVIGGYDADTGWFSGLIDEVRIYNYSMTQSEIQASMNATVHDLPITYPNATNVTGFIRLGDLSAAINMTMNGTRVFNSSANFLTDSLIPATGIYQYNVSYWETQNYSAKNVSRILNVPQGSLSFNLYLNGTEGSVTYTYPNASNATLTISPRFNNEGAFSLLRNGTPIGSGGNNNRSEELLFGAGAYNYSANASGFTNYTISDILSGRILTITRGNPNIALFLNGTQADVSSYVYGNPTNATAFRTSILYNNEGTLQLWRNGTSLGSGGPGNISEILVLPAGIHNYSAILINIANYTYSNVSYVMTIQKATPILGIATNNSNNSGQQYGTVLYLSFDENASSTAYDSSGYGNDASWTGGANNVTRNLTGRFGNALTFDKKDDFITVADSDSLSMRDFTLSAWIKPTFLGSHNYILGKGVSDADEEYILAILSNGAVYFDWGWNGYNQTAAGLITANNWYHIAAVYTNSSNYGRIYIDGALINSVGAQDTGGQITGTSSSLVIGASRGGTLLFNGTIDEVKIYNYSRSTDEINASARGVWNDIPLIYPRIVNTTGFVRLGDSSAAINMTRNGTRISNGTANAAVNESILLAAGIYQYNVSYWESQNYSAKNISKILNIPKAQAVATLWFNESNADRNYNRSEWINATGFISTPQGFFAGENKLLNLTFNYTGLRSANFTNIGVITGANNTIYNITWNDVPGAYNFTLWFDGDQNYSAASVSHIASVYGNLWVGLNNPLQVYYAMNENVTLNVTVRDFLRGDEIPSVNVSMNLTSFWANSFKNTPYYSRNVSMLNFVGGNYSGKYNVTDLHAGNYSLNYTAARDFYRVGRNFTIIYVNESANANISSLFVNVSANVTQNQAVLVNGSIDRIGNIGINGTLDITIRKINPDNVGLVVANASALDVYEAIYNSTLVDTGYNVTLIDDDTVNANTWTPSLFNAIVWAEASYDNFFMQYIDNNIWSQVVAGKPVVMTYYGMIKGAVDMGLSTGWGGRFGRDVNVKTPHSVTGNYTAINVSEIQDATYNSLYLFDFHGTELADDGTSGRTIIGVNDTNGGRVVVYGPYRANHWTAEAKDIFLRSVYWAIYGTAQTTFAQTQNITVPYTFEDYFNESDGTAEGWNATVGSWIVQNNAYIQTANATADTGAIAKLKNNSYWTDYTVSMRFSMIGGVANNTQIYFRYDGPSKYYLLNISSNGEFAFYKNTGSGATNITDASPNLITISQDTWYTLNITARENKLDAEIGGLGRINATDASGTIIGGTIALGTHRSSSRFDNIAVYHHDGGNKRGTHYFKREWPVGTQSPGAYRATATFTYYNTTGNRTILAGSVDFNVTSNLTAQINITLNSTLLTSRQALAINGNITAGGNLAVTGNFTLSVWNLTHEISNIQNTSRSVTTSSLYTISETWLNYYNVSGNYSVRANYTWSGGSDSQLANFTISYNVSADVNVSMNAPKYNASTNATVNVTITNPMQVTITTLTIACNVNDYNGLLVASAATSPDVGNRTIGSISASAAKWNSTQWNVSANNAGTYSIRCNVSDAGGLIGFDTRSFDITRLNATLSINANRTGTNYTISDAVGIQGNITAVGGINASGRLVVEVYNASQRIAQVYSANTLTGNLNALNITALNLAFLTYRNLTGAYTLNATFNYTNETGSEIIRSSTTQFNISSTTNATLSSTVNKASYTTTEAATVTTVITSLSNEAITNGNLTVYIFNSTAFTPTYRQYWNSSLFNVSAGGSATQTDTVNLTSFPSGTQYIVANFTFGGQFVNTTNAFTVAVIGPATNLTIKFFVGDATNYMVYTTASGEVTANRTNASSEWGSRWIASFFNDSVIGLYGTGGGITVSASNTTTEHRINVNGMIRESRMYAIVTQGTRASFQNRAELLDASKFTTQINPSFGYPLREKSLLSLKLKYDDIDVQGSETLRKGTYKLRIENNGTSGGKTMIHIKTI